MAPLRALFLAALTGCASFSSGIVAPAGDVAGLRAAFERDPGSVELASALARAGEPGGYEVWAALAPRDALPLVELSGRALASGDPASALAAADRAIERQPRNAGGFAARGRALLAEDETGAAVAALRSAVELDPGDGAAFHDLGRALLEAGENEEAMRALIAASLLLPEDPSVHRDLAKAYEGMGYLTEAVAELRIALALGDCDETALRRLTALADARWWLPAEEPVVGEPALAQRGER